MIKKGIEVCIIFAGNLSIMKRLLPLIILALYSYAGKSQCPTSSTPTSNCTNLEIIAYLSIDNISVNTNSVCSPNGYSLYTAPVWTLNVGSAHMFTVFTTSPASLTGDNSIGGWIDFNNDGSFSSTEKIFGGTNSIPQPSGGQNFFGYSGFLSIPSTAVTGTKLKMRVRVHSGVYPHNDPCSSYPSGTLNGETEDYFVYLTCASTTLAVSPSNPAACAGNPLTLSASGAYSYTWQPGNLQGPTHTFSPTATTQYTVYAENNFGCIMSKVYTVTVNPSPVIMISSGSPAVCAGESATLSVSSPGNYQWQPGGASGQSLVISPSAPATYTVKDLSSNCTATETITVKPRPNVTASVGSPVICYSTAASFQANGASTYTWSINNMTGSNISPVLTSGGSYSVTGEDANGCKNTAVVNIVVNPGAAFTYTTNNTTLSIFNTSPPALGSFTWNFGDQNISNQAQPGSHVYSTSGTYTVKLEATSPPPCPNVSTSFVIQVPSKLAGGTGIAETSAPEKLLTVFPNPARNSLFIRNEGVPGLSSAVEIYNVNGMLTATVYIDSHAGEQVIDISGLAAGNYFLKLNCKTGDVIKQFIKH